MANRKTEPSTEVKNRIKHICFIPEIEKPGIYLIENVGTKKRYIGSTVNLKNRLKQHERALRLGYSINRKIDEDTDAGHNNFFFAILETFEEGTVTNQELANRERYYVELFGTEKEYNFSLFACCRSRLDPGQIVTSHGNTKRTRIALERAANGQKKSL